MEVRRAQETTADYEQLRRDWILSSEQFRKEILAAADGQAGPNYCGAQRQETRLEKAERVLNEEISRLGGREEQFLSGFLSRRGRGLSLGRLLTKRP